MNDGRQLISGRRPLKLSDGRLGRGITEVGIEGREGRDGRVTVLGRLPLKEPPEGGLTAGTEGLVTLGRLTLGGLWGKLGRVTVEGRCGVLGLTEEIDGL